MKQYETTLAGEKLELTLEGTVLALTTGGVTIQTECKNLRDAEELFHDVESDLHRGNLFLDEGDEGVDEGVANCYVGLVGKVKGKDSHGSKMFTSFKEFVQWGKDNRFDLY